MPSFVDYNEQLLIYKNKLGNKFPVDKESLSDRKSDTVLDHNDDVLVSEKSSDIIANENNSTAGIDINSFSIDDLTNEAITKIEKLDKDGNLITEEIIGTSRQKLRASLSVPESDQVSRNPGINIDDFSVDDLTDEYYREAIAAVEATENAEAIDASAEIIGQKRMKLRASTAVPNSDIILKEYDISSSNKLHPTGEGVYQPIGSGFTGLADVGLRTVGIPTSNKYELITSNDLIASYTSREEKSLTNDGLNMFLYSIIPFMVSKVAGMVSSTVSTIQNIGTNKIADNLAFGAIRNAIYQLNYLSYFTPGELIASLTVSPFALSFLSAIQLKDNLSSVKWSRTAISTVTLAKSWDPSDVKDNLLSATGKFNKNIGEIYEFIHKAFHWITGQKPPETPYKPGMESNSSSILEEYQMELRKYRDKIGKALRDYNQDKYSNYYLDYGIGPIGESNSGIYTKFSERSDTIRNDDTGFKTKSLRDFADYWKLAGGDAHMKAYPGKDKIIGNYENADTKYNEDIKKLKQFKNTSILGYIHVYPSSTDSSMGIKSFKIPFQFNPVVVESGQQAVYEGQAVLHRQGQAMSYVRTDGQTLTLDTDYWILSDGESDVRKTNNDTEWSVNVDPQDTFYSTWTPGIVSAIEKSLRSLVLPISRISSDDVIDFHKPPMVKIVLDNSTEGSEALLKYSLKGNGSLNISPKYYHRTYIVTGVTIARDADTPYYMSNDTLKIGTHGFKVTIQLTEIDHNYVGAAADFYDYYSSFNSTIQPNEFIETKKEAAATQRLGNPSGGDTVNQDSSITSENGDYPSIA